MNNRVLHIIQKSSYDGATVYAVRLCLHMKEYNHEIVSCFKGNACGEILKLGIKCINLLNIQNISYKYLFLKYWKFIRIIQKESYDVIHYHQGGVGILFLALLLGKKAKIIHHFHSGNMIGDNKRNKISILHRYLLKILGRCTYQIAVARHVAVKYNRQIHQSERLTVIENAIPFEFTCHSDYKFAIGYLGRITKEKGFLLFNEIIKNENLISKNLQYYAMGDVDPEMRDEVITNRVLKFIKPSFDIGNFFTKVDLIIFPSCAPEGNPLVVLESIAFDVGVITLDGSASLEVLGDYPLLIKENTLPLILEKINSYYKDEKLRNILSYAHQSICQKYNFPNMLDKIELIYNSVN